MSSLVRVRMLTLAAGPDHVLLQGQAVDLPAAEAEAYLAGGFAERVALPVTQEQEEQEETVERKDEDKRPPEKAKPETATRPAPENASTRPAVGHGRRTPGR